VHRAYLDDKHQSAPVKGVLTGAEHAAVALLDTYDSPLSVPFYEQHLGYSRRALRLRKALR